MAYSPAAGFGWSAGAVQEWDFAAGDDLRRDQNFSADATFAVDLPDGSYDVTLTMGDPTFAHDRMEVSLEGAVVDEVTTAGGQFVVRTYRATVADGRLTLRLRDAGGNDPFAVISALVVARVDAPLAPDPASDSDL
jgi:fibronectin type 3 domain-containing protein